MKHKGRTRPPGAFSGICLVLTLLSLLLPTTARAHKVTVFAWVEGDTVFTESKFSGGRTAKDARIEVFNFAGEKLLEGRTDDRGRFAFTPPRPEALRIVLMAGTGHRNEWRLAAEEFTGGPRAPEPPRTVTVAETASPQAASAADAGEVIITLSPDDLQALIEASLDKKLAPIVQRLRPVEQGPSLTDIIGGLGYILGLVGLASYLHARRRSG